MKATQWLGIGGLLLVFAVGFFTLWRGARHRRDDNPDNWTNTDGGPTDSSSH